MSVLGSRASGLPGEQLGLWFMQHAGKAHGYRDDNRALSSPGEPWLDIGGLHACLFCE